MEKNGFTLIEIIVIISILALLTTIVVPNVQKIVSNSKDKACKSIVDSIEDAANSYTYLYSGIVDNDILSNGYFEIELIDLQREGLLKVDIKNPYTNELLLNTNKVKIIKDGNVYKYTYMGDECK